METITMLGALVVAAIIRFTAAYFLWLLPLGRGEYYCHFAMDIIIFSDLHYIAFGYVCLWELRFAPIHFHGQVTLVTLT